MLMKNQIFKICLTGLNTFVVLVTSDSLSVNEQLLQFFETEVQISEWSWEQFTLWTIQCFILCAKNLMIVVIVMKSMFMKKKIQ